MDFRNPRIMSFIKSSASVTFGFLTSGSADGLASDDSVTCGMIGTRIGGSSDVCPLAKLFPASKLTITGVALRISADSQFAWAMIFSVLVTGMKSDAVKDGKLACLESP